MADVNKQQWLDWAEITDAWRVVPRAILFGYCFATAKLVFELVTWYMGLPIAERTIEATSFAAGVITSVTGLATWATKFYIDSGRDWTKQ